MTTYKKCNNIINKCIYVLAFSGATHFIKNLPNLNNNLKHYSKNKLLTIGCGGYLQHCFGCGGYQQRVFRLRWIPAAGFRLRWIPAAGYRLRWIPAARYAK